MKYLVVIEKGNNSWDAYVPDLPGCVAVGETREEAHQLINKAVDLHIADMKDKGETIPTPKAVNEFVEASNVYYP